MPRSPPPWNCYNYNTLFPITHSALLHLHVANAIPVFIRSSISLSAGILIRATRQTILAPARIIGSFVTRMSQTRRFATYPSCALILVTHKFPGKLGEQSRLFLPMQKNAAASSSLHRVVGKCKRSSRLRENIE